MMKTSKKFLAVAIVAVFVVAAAAYFGVNAATTVNSSGQPQVGAYAPDYSLVYANGTTATVSSLRGSPILLWFIATWCSGCAQGNELLNGNMSYFSSKGVKVVEVELYNDLGYSGMSITRFVSEFAPRAYSSPDFTMALSSYNLTKSYDGKGYLDIYYLINPEGKIVYENDGTLAATIGQLKQQIAALGL